MTGPGDPQGRVAALERLIQAEVGRNMTALFAAAQGGLLGAAMAVAALRSGGIGVITGFYVPRGTPPAAETDGPIGAALLIKALTAIGLSCRLATDEACRSACAAALAGAGAAAVPIDAARPGAALDDIIARWRDAGIVLALAIERCGRSADGAPRNMRGEDISAHTAALDELFLAGPWDTIAVGDGGNEIGMGALPPDLIARHVDHGARIACVTPAHHLIVAGVSNWGAYALLAALAVLRADWRERLLACLDPEVDRAILKAAVEQGPAVDGVSRRRTLTVDNLDLAVHHEKLRALRALVEAGHGL
ncbi:MAG: glutamate cyclase domain-containing protein [Stellaceae bacterium]